MLLGTGHNLACFLDTTHAYHASGNPYRPVQCGEHTNGTQQPQRTNQAAPWGCEQFAHIAV